MKVGRVFYFDASHHLPNYQGACERVHGHTYRLEVVVEDDVGQDGMVLDFGRLKQVVVEGVLEELDHCDLNQVLDNPTAENIVEWIWSRLCGQLNLDSITLWEGRGKWVRRKR
ncbi:MAG: 6-carboxytetrahydropterin synthase QueD [Candidatus Altiarchaeales archaeon]|nr:6-carboxytetrahydropterin synthase QueD [Candidatus Altiarchaeales archaeon]